MIGGTQGLQLVCVGELVKAATQHGFWRFVPLQRMRLVAGAFAWSSMCLWVAVASGYCTASESSSEGEPTELDEVLIKGSRGLDLLRLEMIRLEDEFHARYNELNSNDLYDIHCAEEARTGTRLRGRYCRANFEARAHEVEGQTTGQRRKE